MSHLARTTLVAFLVLAGCVQSKERQVVQSKDPIEVGLRGQRERLLEKAGELERSGRTAAALTILDSLFALYPDDAAVRARRAAAQRDLAAARGAETAAIDAGDGEHP